MGNVRYFSGHGGKNQLALSDSVIELQELIELIAAVDAKNKIIILDSCYSGGFSINSIPEMEVYEMVESFAGHGYAVMASCGAEQRSGFNYDEDISLYTSFVCEAMTAKCLIRKGKKSLEDINQAVSYIAEKSNKEGKANIQQPIFRASMGGTVFFDVEEYNPYQVQKIYEETDRYIIYSVKAEHLANAKRLFVKAILRFQFSPEEIAKIAKEIRDKVLFCEVYQNEISEMYHKGKPANIVWCFFGYDEEDMIYGNFIYRTTWVDELQDKEYWYQTSKAEYIIDDIYFHEEYLYEMRKNLNKNDMDSNEMIEEVRKYTSRMITLAERYITMFREYCNNTLTEEVLIDNVEPIGKELTELYYKINDLPPAPVDLYEWVQAYINIVSTIHDFSLYYSKNNLDCWSSANRKLLFKNTIKRYELELENLIMEDNILEEIEESN